MAKILIITGILFLAAGIFWHFGWLNWLGKLPGDIRIEKENARFYFPITTCILLSGAVTLILKIIQWFQR